MSDEQERITYLEGVLHGMTIGIAKGTIGKIDAIRAYRAATGSTLKDSKDFVESLAPPNGMEDSRIQRVEDRIRYLEMRIGRLEDPAGVVGSPGLGGKHDAS